tara:strand:- start:3843 stop:4550 length:708 start_codon:yes stop_codon:yes gene_type:complete
MKVPFYGLKLPNSDQIILSEVESRHCIKVLRYKVGDEVQVLDGRGNLYSCSISSEKLQQCTLDINATDFKDRDDCELHIVIAPPKNPDRIDWLIEKSVEMGASRVSFALSERSIRNKIKLDRIERISIAAMKQSCSRYKLRIDDITPLSDVLEKIEATQRLIPHLEEGKRISIHNALKPKKDTCILIGPEGDFTLQEIKSAISNKFKPVSLGDRRLRTETAAIMVIGVFNYVNGY